MGIMLLGGCVDNSFSTLLSSGLSTRGFLFVGCGSVGSGGQKMGKSLGKDGVTHKDAFCKKWT